MSPARRNGLTRIEALMILGILACIGVMLFPALQKARDASRRVICTNNIKSLGLAFHNYAQANKRMAASSGVSRDADGRITAVDGWSWLALMLPFMDCGANEHVRLMEIYNSLDIEHGRPLVEPEGAKGTPHADALAARVPGLICPASGCSMYLAANGRPAALTNYKPLGATHIESLSQASPNPMPPKYKADHPDGSCYPGTYTSFGEIRKGTSNTVFLTETIEPRFARWTVGAEATLVGLPRSIEFEKCTDGINQFVPKGYKAALDKKPEALKEYWTYRTYLEWDCDKEPYDGADGTLGGKFGPGGNHIGVVNHLFLDGSSHFLKRDIDVVLYMWLIKRTY
jgi:hypothetical protein